RRPSRSPLFPYTTLFRSDPRAGGAADRCDDEDPAGPPPVATAGGYVIVCILVVPGHNVTKASRGPRRKHRRPRRERRPRSSRWPRRPLSAYITAGVTRDTSLSNSRADAPCA